MRRFAVLVIASVLAPALISAAVQTRPVVDMATLPGVIDIGFGTLPGFLDEPVFKPHPMPELEHLPESIDVNPCNACFEYMTSLIDQLTVGSVAPALPQLPEVVKPTPEALPLPVAPEVEINPIPMPVAPEAGVRPLPLPIAPEAGVRPLPLPIAPEALPLPIPQVIRPAF